MRFWRRILVDPERGKATGESLALVAVSLRPLFGRDYALDTGLGSRTVLKPIRGVLETIADA